MFLFTVFMLVVITWLFFNGMNEKRWVDAHSHDESVASDPGFLPNFSTVSRAMGMPQGGTAGKLSIDQENTRFARAVATVKRKTARYSDGLEKRAAAARVDDASGPRSAADENDFFGRMVKRVGAFTRGMDAGIDRRMQAGREAGSQAPRGGNMAARSSAFERTAAKVGERDEALGDRVTRKFNEKTAPEGRSRTAAEEGGFFNKMVGKVSSTLEGIEKKVDARLAKSHADPSNPAKDDFIGRMSAKIGARVDGFRERLVYPDSSSDRDASRGKDDETH